MNILESAIAFVCPEYIISVIILTYLIISAINTKRKTGIKSVVKKLLTVGSGLILGFAFVKFNIVTIKAVIPNFFISIVAYDYLVKELINRITVLQYKK